MNVLFYILSMFLFFSLSTVSAAQYDATVQFANRVTLSMPVSGVIKSVNVVIGQHIQAGKLLVELEKIPFVAAVSKTKADVTINKTKQTEAIRDYKQAQELYDRTVLSNVELENAKLKADRATAEYDIAQAQLETAEYNLAHANVIAPFDGIVLKVHAKENETINNLLASQPLIVFAAENQYTVKILSKLKSLDSFAVAKTGKISIGGKQFIGTVISVGLEPVAEQGLEYEVIVGFKAKNVVLRSGQVATVDFP